MVDILNCEKGCLYGTGTEPCKYDSDDAFLAINKIKNNSKKRGIFGAFAQKSSPKKRLKALNRKFAKLNPDDFIRRYTDNSANVSLNIPSDSQLLSIYSDMNK